jgi:hypothetical protein
MQSVQFNVFAHAGMVLDRLKFLAFCAKRIAISSDM